MTLELVQWKARELVRWWGKLEMVVNHCPCEMNLLNCLVMKLSVLTLLATGGGGFKMTHFLLQICLLLE